VKIFFCRALVRGKKISKRKSEGLIESHDIPSEPATFGTTFPITSIKSGDL
jgi:hypothetical protein